MGKVICVRNFRDSGKKYVAGEEYKDVNLKSLVGIGVVKDESQLSNADKKHIDFIQETLNAIKKNEALATEREEVRKKRLQKEFADAQKKEKDPAKKSKDASK